MYTSVTTIGGVREYLSDAAVVAFDFETAPDEPYRNETRAALDAHKSHIVGISFSISEGSGIYVPLTHRVGANADAAEIMAFLAEFAASTSIIKVAHNLAFESMFLYARGIVLQPPCYDTIAAAQMTLKSNTAFRTLADSGLKTLVPELVGVELPGFSEVAAGRFFDELNPQDTETTRYACADSDYALRLYHLFNGWFDTWLPKHHFIAEQIESPTAVYCGLMKYNGLLVDAERMAEKQAEAEAKLASLREEIAFMIGDVNIGANASTAAFKKYLYGDLGLPVLKTTAKYQEAADDEALVLLSEWCAENRPELVPLFRLVQAYRRWGKIKSTYIDGYKQHINSATGRIHADLMPLATETGRFACRKPNLQNCFDDQTEILTKRGFVLFRDLTSLDTVAAWDNGDIYFVQPKSTLLSIAQEVLLGSENVSNIPWQSLGDRFNKAELFGKLANIFADLPSKNIDDGGMFKALTGEDYITAERKNKDPFSFRPYARLLFSCNEIPKNYSDRSEGFYRRLIIIRFDRPVPGDRRDPNLRERIAVERNGILLWALEGLKRLMDNSYRFTETERTRDELRRYKVESNSALMFLEENCVIGNGFVTREELYTRYKDYCAASGMKSQSQTNFNKEIESNFVEVHRGQDKVSGRRVWRGIEYVEGGKE
ncbi:hypothetical protein FACS1894196_0120 [Clostridia bacterium]|nr:hypothetical protein FACS1894196_0120 [Clostridia bacterium]